MTRSIEPIVSTDWLEARLPAGGLVIIDIREPYMYEAGHIPQALSVPFSPVSAWATSSHDLFMELPEEAELFKVLGGFGIMPGSKVVVVGGLDEPPASPYSLADATRVATTLIYAGVENVAILDGGYPKWEREGRETAREVPEVVAVAYTGAVRGGTFVSTEYVRDHIGRSLILDGRDPDQYFGVTVDRFAGKRGHIPTARCLPAPWIWEEDGTYKPTALLGQMAAGVLGLSADQEIIVYCSVGGYASAWWYVLTQMLGRKDVKFYDGATEAWSKDNAMVTHSWTL